LGRTFDLVVMAGNVLIFVPPGSEGQVIANGARWLRPGGHLVTGYSIRPGAFGPPQHDALAAGSGLVLQERWSTWDKDPFTPGDRYAVTVHRREI
jgi:SAM-dependent methyltransferase